MPQTDPQFCFFWIDHWSTCMTKAEWASWAQGIGTIGALFLTVWVAWWSSTTQSRQASAALQKLQEAVARACQEGADACTTQQPEVLATLRGVYRSYRTMAERFRLDGVKPSQAAGLLELHKVLEEAEHGAVVNAEGRGNYPHWANEFRSLCERVEQARRAG